MIECVHAYWLLLWLIGLFSRYSHRNCIINYPRRCHGRTMESPDEYLGRLNFLGTHGVKGHHGALLRWKDGRSVVCVFVRLCKHPWCTLVQFLPFLEDTHKHTQGKSPSSTPIDFVSVSLYCNFISVCRQIGGGPGEGRRVRLCTSFSKWWTFLSGVPLLVMLAA